MLLWLFKNVMDACRILHSIFLKNLTQMQHQKFKVHDVKSTKHGLTKDQQHKINQHRCTKKAMDESF